MTNETDRRGGRLRSAARSSPGDGAQSTDYRDGWPDGVEPFAAPRCGRTNRGGARVPLPADAIRRAGEGGRHADAGPCNSDPAATGGNGGSGGNTRGDPPTAARCRSRTDRGNTGNGRKPRCATRVDFAAVNGAARPHLEALCRRWLPGGRRVGHEWVCGSLRGETGESCRVNLHTGRWADFATLDDRGGDPVSLAAAIYRLSQSEAARCLAAMLGLDAEGPRHG